MQYLGLAGTIVLIVVNLWGLTLFTGFLLPRRWAALAAGPWLMVTAFFCIESYVGLGPLRGIGLAGTVGSLLLVLLSCTSGWLGRVSEARQIRLRAWQAEFSPRSLAGMGAVFGLLLLYALAWRFAFPDVDGSSEKIADLSYICSYLSGAKIPVPDAWLAPYSSVQYYSFQHYAAALLGRLLGLAPGLTYNLAFCTLIALIGASFAGVVFLLSQRRLTRVIVLAAVILGGSGATLVVHLTDQQVSPWSAMRYVGSANYDRAPLGPILKDYASHYERMDLPGEPFAYSIYLGDYHAPLSGYYIFCIGAIAAILYERTRSRRYPALIGATLVWSVLANTWSLPLQALAVLLWIAANLRQWRIIIPWCVAGAAFVWLAAALYIKAFTAATAGYDTAIKLVPASQHTPPLLFLLFLFPTIGLVLLALYSRLRSAFWLGIAGLIFLFVSEFFYVDDVYSGMYERFNTTLKWWPWIAAAVAVTLGPLLIDRAARKWVRWASLLLCIYPTLFAFDLAGAWFRPDKPAWGKMEGTRFLTKDTFARLMLGRMREEAPGLVIERPTKDAFTNSACLPLFAGHRMWLGWVGHEQLWHGYREDIQQRQDRLFQFFNGEMPDAGRWLAAQKIDYVLWYQPDDTPERWAKVNAAIGPDFVWCEIYTEGDGRTVGFWRLPHK